MTAKQYPSTNSIRNCDDSMKLLPGMFRTTAATATWIVAVSPWPSRRTLFNTPRQLSRLHRGTYSSARAYTRKALDTRSAFFCSPQRATLTRPRNETVNTWEPGSLCLQTLHWLDGEQTFLLAACLGPTGSHSGLGHRLTAAVALNWVQVRQVSPPRSPLAVGEVLPKQ